MTRVAILWHMHQPFYEDLVTHEHILPWVRLHALKDYYGMVALMREFPEVKVTFNLVPSLLVQLEAFAPDHARDRSLELSLTPAQDLDQNDIRLMLGNFFHAQRQRSTRDMPNCRLAAATRRLRSPPTICATCRSGTSSRGSIPGISSPTRASAAWSRRAATLTRATRPCCAKWSSRF